MLGRDGWRQSHGSLEEVAGSRLEDSNPAWTEMHVEKRRVEKFKRNSESVSGDLQNTSWRESVRQLPA